MVTVYGRPVDSVYTMLVALLSCSHELQEAQRAAFSWVLVSRECL